MTATLPCLQPELRFPGDLEAAFMSFHVDNPQVYAELVERARRWKRAGHRHGSINMLFEAIRYDFGVRVGESGDGFRLNNNHRAYYARLIMRRELDLDGFFETRDAGEKQPTTS